MGTVTKTEIDAAKTAEAVGDLIGNKIGVKIASMNQPKEKEKEKTKEIEELYIPTEKKTTDY